MNGGDVLAMEDMSDDDLDVLGGGGSYSGSTPVPSSLSLSSPSGSGMMMSNSDRPSSTRQPSLRLLVDPEEGAATRPSKLAQQQQQQEESPPAVAKERVLVQREYSHVMPGSASPSSSVMPNPMTPSSRSRAHAAATSKAPAALPVLEDVKLSKAHVGHKVNVAGLAGPATVTSVGSKTVHVKTSDGRTCKFLKSDVSLIV